MWRFLSGLRSWQLFLVAGTLFVVDLLLADPLPFIDEILLGVMTLMLARWRKRQIGEGDSPRPMRMVLTALLLVQLVDVTPPASTGYARYGEHTEYDHHFSKYSKRYFGVAFDWHYFKAQAVAESNLRPAARSSAGAIGVMQIMPATFEEIRKSNPAIAGGLEEPRWNIAAGIWYDRKNYLAWTADRTLEEQLKFMFGSYNAGRGNILRAQRVALGEGMPGTSWMSIAQCLPRVTGRHSRETLTYVSRIFDIKKVLR